MEFGFLFIAMPIDNFKRLEKKNDNSKHLIFSFRFYMQQQTFIWQQFEDIEDETY